MDTKERFMSRMLSELVSAQNATVDLSMDKIVENATNSLDADSRHDSDEFRKTTELMVMNSLVMGDVRDSSPF